MNLQIVYGKYYEANRPGLEGLFSSIFMPLVVVWLANLSTLPVGVLIARPNGHGGDHLLMSSCDNSGLIQQSNRIEAIA